jgi:general secretion pathway protein K
MVDSGSGITAQSFLFDGGSIVIKFPFIPFIPFSKNDQGSATVTALIVVGVTAVMLAGLMWRQQIQVRSLENARDLVQAQWLQRAAIDFARLVLAEDQRSSQYDHLGETWALPLADGKVADFLKNADVPDEIAAVTLSGQLTDAQSQFNLNNLWDKDFKGVNPAGVQGYGRLLEAVGLDRGLAQLTAQGVLQADMPLNDIDGLLKLPIYNPTILNQIRPFITILPILTTVNVNTAPPEVLMAVLSGLNRSAAASFVQQRSTSPIKSADEITGLLNKMGLGQGVTIDAALVDVRSQFWLGRTEIRLGRGIFVSSALIQRSQTPLANGNLTQVIWSRTGKTAIE